MTGSQSRSHPDESTPALRVELAVRHLECWLIDLSSETQVGILGRGVYHTADRRANSHVTLFSDQQTALDEAVKPRRYTDLEERVPISSSTLAARLEEGVQLDAWQLDRIIDEDGDRTVYRLTPSGENVFDALERNGGLEASRKIREHERTLADIRELLIGRLQDDE